jgi:hypothetical protein
MTLFLLYRILYTFLFQFLPVNDVCPVVRRLIKGIYYHCHHPPWFSCLEKNIVRAHCRAEFHNFASSPCLALISWTTFYAEYVTVCKIDQGTKFYVLASVNHYTILLRDR